MNWRNHSRDDRAQSWQGRWNRGDFNNRNNRDFGRDRYSAQRDSQDFRGDRDFRYDREMRGERGYRNDRENFSRDWDFGRDRDFGSDRESMRNPDYGRDRDFGSDRNGSDLWYGNEPRYGSDWLNRDRSRTDSSSRWGNPNDYMNRGYGDNSGRYFNDYSSRGDWYSNNMDDSFSRTAGGSDYWAAGSDRNFGESGSGDMRYGIGQNQSMNPGARSHAGRGPKGWRRSDDRIREEVCETLSRHPDIDASEIEVTVKDGEVTLAGQVDDRRAKRLAEDVVENLSGVSDVHNQIRVQGGFLRNLFGDNDRQSNSPESVGESRLSNQSSDRSEYPTSPNNTYGNTDKSNSGSTPLAS